MVSPGGDWHCQRLALLLVASISLCLRFDTIAADYTTPRHTVNLDAAPGDRWKEIATKYAEQVNVTLQWLQKEAGPGSPLHPVVETMRAAVLAGGSWTEEHLGEMKGIADALNQTVDTVQVANLFYEFSAIGSSKSGDKGTTRAPWGCTSIVAQNTNGSIMHARNQDYSMPGLANITITVDFTRGGKIAYTGNTFVGYIGLPTAMRPGGWSVSCDARFTGGASNLVASAVAAKEGAKTIGIFVRETLERAATYAEAIDALNTTHLIAPAYYIIAGTEKGEGAVVTRNRTTPDNIVDEGIWSLGTKPAEFYRLETNWDHWKPDNETDGRRPKGNALMNATGPDNVDFQHLHNVLSTKPVLASTTVYSAFMFPKNGLYNAITREHPKSQE